MWIRHLGFDTLHVIHHALLYVIDETKANKTYRKIGLMRGVCEKRINRFIFRGSKRVRSKSGETCKTIFYAVKSFPLSLRHPIP